MDNLDTLTGAKLQEVLTSLDCVVEKNLQLEKDVLKFQEEILQVKKSNYDMRIQLDENRREVKNLQQCHNAISSVPKRSGIEKDSRHTTGHNEIEKLSRKVTDLAKRLDTLTTLLNEGMTRVDMNEERLERNLKVFNRIHVAGQNTLDLNKEVSTIWEQLDQINEVLDTYEEEKERKQQQRKHEQERRKLRQQQQKQSQQQQQQKPTQQQQRQQQTQSQQRQQPPQQQQKPTQQHQQQQQQTQPQQQQKQQPKRQPHQQQQQKQPPQQQQQTQSQQQQRQQQPQPQQPQQPKRQHQQQTQLHQCENPIQLEKLTLSEIRNQCNFCVQSNKNPQLVTGECVTVASWSLENHGRYVPYKDTQLEHYIYSKYFDLKTGRYQIPVGGRYKFFVAPATYNSGNVNWFLTASNGEQRYLYTTTGWYKDIEVEWVCEKGIEIWLEAYRVDGNAIFWDCKYRGEFVGLEK